jgi:hypothetical protein
MIKLKDILLNEDIPSDVKSAFGEIPFGGRISYAAITTGKNDVTEPDTDFEDVILDTLALWTGGESLSKSSYELYKHYPILKKAAKYFPNILKPTNPNGTEVYRGLSSPNVLDDNILKKMSINDFERIATPEGDYFVYKKPINYVPHNDVQSWTSNFTIASRFGYQILKSKQNDEFLFNEKLIKLVFGDYEDEILHFGRNYSNDVYLMFSQGEFRQIKKKMQSVSFDKPKTKSEVEDILQFFGIKNYKINKDLTVDVNGEVQITGTKLRSIPVQFGTVTGDFWCYGNQLTTLNGAPRSVGGSFYCSYNQLTSLEGAPQSVGGSFYCSNNQPPLPRYEKNWAEKNIKATNFEWGYD